MALGWWCINSEPQGPEPMPRRRSSGLAAPFQGKWRIVEMDIWPDDAVDLEGPAFIAIAGERGEMRFVALSASLDVRYQARRGGAVAEFSWQGFDDGEPCSGRGWVEPGTAGRLVGHVFIHDGDDSGFVCEPWA
jgi:hypothetical protein